MRARAGDDASADVREEEDFEVDDAMDDASDDESDDESGDESDESDDDASDDDDDDDDGGEDDRSVRRDRWDEFYRLRSMIDDTDEGRVARAMALRAFQDEVRAMYAPENLHSGESDSDYENGNESVSVDSGMFHEGESSEDEVDDEVPAGPFVTYGDYQDLRRLHEQYDHCEERLRIGGNKDEFHHQVADCLCAFPRHRRLATKYLSHSERTKPRAMDRREFYEDYTCSDLKYFVSGEAVMLRNGFKLAAHTNEPRYSDDDRVSFTVYSMAYDEESRTLAVCGTGSQNTRAYNVMVYRCEQSETDTVVERIEEDMGGLMALAHNPGRVWSNGQREVGAMWKDDDPAWDFVQLCKANIGFEYGHDDYSDDDDYDPFHEDSAHEVEQANCVRFGWLEDPREPGKPRELRLILSSNDGHVYVCRLDETDRAILGASPYKLEKDFVIDNPVPVNCAVASPCGKFIAFSGDSHYVCLKEFSLREAGDDGLAVYCRCSESGSRSARSYVDAGAEYSFRIPCADDNDERMSSQYLTYSGDGRYLAATSDAYHSVTVWRVENVIGYRGEAVDGIYPIAHFYACTYACLPVTFSISNPSIMIWAERGAKLHVFDCAEAEEHREEMLNIRDDFLEKFGSEAELRERLRREKASFTKEHDGRDDYFFGSAEPTSKDYADPDALAMCAFVDMTRKSRLQAGWYKPNLSLRERYEVWRNSLVDKNTGKHFSIQTIRYGVHRTFITGLSVSQGVPIQKESDVSMDEHVSDVILYSSGTAVHKLELQTGLRRDMKNFQDFSRSFQRAVVAFLLCVKRSRRNSSGDICLADLPSDVIRDIIAKMAMPVYKWRQKPHVR